MDYCKIYNSLINRARNRTLECYSEKHHVIPKCMGGSDESFNIVKLTPEEHYVAHQLLLKIYLNSPQLVYAANMMTVGRTTNKIYGWIKRRWILELRLSQRGKKNSQFGKIWITNGETNKKWNKLEPVPSGWFTGGKNLKPRSSLIKNNLIEMKRVYESTKSVNAAFKSVGIARNGYLAKKFLDLCR
jgi:hypothetical protein